MSINLDPSDRGPTKDTFEFRLFPPTQDEQVGVGPSRSVPGRLTQVGGLEREISTSLVPGLPFFGRTGYGHPSQWFDPTLGFGTPVLPFPLLNEE